MTLTELNRRKNGRRQKKVKWSAIFLVAVLFAIFLALAFLLPVILKDKKSDQHLDKFDRGNDNGNYIPGGGGPEITRMLTRMEGSNNILGVLQWITYIAAVVLFLVLLFFVVEKCEAMHKRPASDVEAAHGLIAGQPTEEPTETGEQILTKITVVTVDPEMKMLPLIAG